MVFLPQTAKIESEMTNWKSEVIFPKKGMEECPL